MVGPRYRITFGIKSRIYIAFSNDCKNEIVHLAETAEASSMAVAAAER